MRSLFMVVALFYGVSAQANIAEIATKAAEAAKSARAAGAVTGAKATHTDLLSPPKWASGVKAANSDSKVNQVVSELGDRMHATWQKGARAEGKTDRFKPMKVDGKPMTDMAQLEAYLSKNGIPKEYHSRYRIQDDGKGNKIVHEDILNMPNRYLAPNNQAENTASAAAVVLFTDRWLAQGGAIDQSFMHAASNFVHEQWMLRNSWAKEQSPELFKPFDQLSKTEAKKDVDIVNDALGLYYKSVSSADLQKLKGAGGSLNAVD